MYEGRCVDLYEDGVCGEDALGERLFLGEDGTVYCDCDEVRRLDLEWNFDNNIQGWLRHEGRCYQEFTPSFCPENQILNLGNYRRIRDGRESECKRNPCIHPTLPHTNFLPHQ